MIWTNGKIIPPEAISIDVRDETFQHGLGLFETLRTWNGHLTLLTRHLERMQRSAGELGLSMDSSQLPDNQAVLNLIEANRSTAAGPIEDVRIRITLSGGRFDPQPHPGCSTLWMTAGTLASPRANRAAVIQQSIQVAIDDLLAWHKTLNYWRKRIAWTQAVEAGADEVLCVTPDGLVCEGTRANVFLVLGPALITPSTDCPLLPGIMRRVVLDHAERLGLEIVEGLVPLESLETADEAFLTNSVQGMLPISRLFDRDLPAPGPVTERLWSEILPWLESGGMTR
jgi:branched-subunit amino acid aminotransferase/4-amino-4-deoxychorismate lyase